MTHPLNEQAIRHDDATLRVALFVGATLPHFLTLNRLAKHYDTKHDARLASDWAQKKSNELFATPAMQDALRETVHAAPQKGDGVYSGGYAIELTFTGSPSDLARIVTVFDRVSRETFKKNHVASYTRINTGHVTVYWRS